MGEWSGVVGPERGGGLGQGGPERGGGLGQGEANRAHRPPGRRPGSAGVRKQGRGREKRESKESREKIV